MGRYMERLRREIENRAERAFRLHLLYSSIDAPGSFNIHSETPFESDPTKSRNVPIEYDYVIDEMKGFVAAHEEGENSRKIRACKVLVCENNDGIWQDQGHPFTTITISVDELNETKPGHESTKKVTVDGYVGQLKSLGELLASYGTPDDKIAAKLESFSFREWQEFEIRRLELSQSAPTLTALNTITKTLQASNKMMIDSFNATSEDRAGVRAERIAIIEYTTKETAEEKKRTERLLEKAEKGHTAAAIEAGGTIIREIGVIANGPVGQEVMKRLMEEPTKEEPKK